MNSNSNWSRSARPDDVSPRSATVRWRPGFTLVELMVLLGVIGVMASIFLPYMERARESDRRARCFDNLMRLSAGLREYAAANGHLYPATGGGEGHAGYTCFTGAGDAAAFGPTSTVQPNDVTASLWLLVRLGLAAPRDFVCPSTDDTADPVIDAEGRRGRAGQRGNFRSPDHLSYSYACPFSSAPGYRLNDTRPPEFALIADRNPGPSATVPPVGAGPLEMSVANSANHGRSGQNVLYADGHAEFSPTCYCGRAGDNIYTALRRSITGVDPSSRRAGPGIPDARGVIGRDVGPAWEADSYLVPTAADAGPSPHPGRDGQQRNPDQTAHP